MSLDEALADAGYLVQPHEVNRRLRDEDPVHWSDEWQGWLVSRHQDVREVLQDYESFSSADQVLRRVEYLLRNTAPDAKEQLLEFWSFQGLFQSDPPAYVRYRSQMIRALTPRLARVEGRVYELANELLDGIEGQGSCELVGDFAEVLPATILFELLGIPPEERSLLLKWADTLTQTFGDSTGGKALESTATLREAYGWAREVTEQRQRAPGDDIISAIVTSDVFGSIGERDVLSTVIFLLTAGQGTLASLIPSCIYLLLRHEDQLERLKRDEKLVEGAVEEALRYESPIQVLGRTASRNYEIGGRSFEPGDMVFAMIGSANRDEACFPEPDRFDIGRDASQHLAFGFRTHHCLGARLARIEARIVVPLILSRLKGLHVESDIEWQLNVAFRVPSALRLTFD